MPEKKADKKTTKSTKPKVRAKNLVIVESPAKAKTLKKFLGDNYKIEASMGHVRDLPKSQLGLDMDNNFEPKYITIRGKGEVLKKLRKEAADAGMVYLATDPDREGEAISWHLQHSLGLGDGKYKRITFNEITKSAVKRSIVEAREIDMDLVDSQQARRALDRIVGYKLSPLLWKKVRKRLSAGRVQSVTLRLICDREQAIDAFTPAEYWTIEVNLAAEKKKPFSSSFYGRQDSVTGEEIKTEIHTQEEAEKIAAAFKAAPPVVREIKRGTRARKSSPPFTTSTLQQEASKILGFAVQKTMLVAQQIYEGVEIKGLGAFGLVSYIRTDSARISDEAFAAAKTYITDNYGGDYAAAEKPEHKTRGRIQDAHEAIRPTDVSLTPERIKESLSKEQYKLYSLIWERFVASCMTPAVYDTMSVKITSGEYILKSSGSLLKFDGYKKVYRKETEDKAEQGLIPELSENEQLSLIKAEPLQHFTQPPPRFTEAALVKTLEENGVGRPSTYSPTISTLVSRGYVTKEKAVLYPSELGETVNEIMESNFEDIVDIEFTSKMEDDLDKVELGEMFWKDLIGVFYYPLDDKIKIAEEKIGEIDIKDEETDTKCEFCGRNMIIKYGRYGKFLACPGFPECKNALPYFPDADVACPLCGERVLIKNTKKGRKYYGCEHSPKCAFMSWHKPTGQKCPRCNEPLVEKGTKKEKKISCTNTSCGYFETIAD